MFVGRARCSQGAYLRLWVYLTGWPAASSSWRAAWNARELSVPRRTMTDVSDDQPDADVPRVFDRLLAAGLSLDRVERHLAAGRVTVDGELVTDRYTPAPPGTRVVLWAG